MSPIIDALTPDIRERGRSRTVEPLPMIALTSEASSSSIVYAICRIDESGRFHDKDIIETAAWTPGERLQVQFIRGVAAFAPAPYGPLAVARRRSIAVPAHTRRLLGLEPKDKALLAAAPESRIVLVYPKPTIDEMIRRFHNLGPAQ
ncbi:hypothetical protein ACFXPA_12270 [Amycolatopsis sp. NPDC059090]|uniref:hypothetical protein n=1 Tax=unclassified Amycolatopsis TaxID=2618356 RepID=UPI00366DAD74